MKSTAADGDEAAAVLLAQPAHDQRGVGVLGSTAPVCAGGAGAAPATTATTSPTAITATRPTSTHRQTVSVLGDRRDPGTVGNRTGLADATV